MRPEVIAPDMMSAKAARVRVRCTVVGVVALALALVCSPRRAVAQDSIPLRHVEVGDSTGERSSVVDNPAIRRAGALPFLQYLEQVGCAPRPTSSSRSSLMYTLSRRIGALPRVPAGDVEDRQLLWRGKEFTLEYVRLSSRLAGGPSFFGYYAHANSDSARRPAVILIQGAGVVPYQAFGFRLSGDRSTVMISDSSSFIGLGSRLAFAGYSVFVPWISDEALYYPIAPWLDLEREGAALHRLRGHGGVYSLLIPELQAVADFLSKDGRGNAGIAAVGWSEGAQIASVDAAFDPRISAVVKLQPPVDWASYRQSVRGSAYGAPFTQLDCEFNEADMAELVAPHPLLFAYANDDAEVHHIARFASPVVASAVKAVYAAAGVPARVTIASAPRDDGSLARLVNGWLDRALSYSSDRVPPVPILADATYPTAPIAQLQAELAQYIVSAGSCPALDVKPDFQSDSAFERSVLGVRRFVHALLGVTYIRPAGGRIVRRDSILENDSYRLEMVVYAADDGITVRGLLATPRYAAPGVTAVLSFDGNYGLAMPFGLPPAGNTEYLHAYADQLARRGVVVFVPFAPRWFPEAASAILRARGLSSVTSWDYVLRYYSAATDMLTRLPEVDPHAISAYGISYSGYAALVATALDPRITTLFYSNPTVNHTRLFQTNDPPGLAVWFSDLCRYPDDILRYLIAPRQFIWENGIQDANAYQVRDLEQVDAIRHEYELLGISDRFYFVRHGGGHETRPEDWSDIFPPHQAVGR